MFGFACDETPELMPLPISLAHRLMENLTLLRKSKKVGFLRPDAKSQVTVRYANGEPVGISAVVVSTQHSPDVSYCDDSRNDHRGADQKDDSRAVSRQLDGFSRQSDRQLRYRRTAWRLRPDRAQDHCRYLWRLWPSWRRSVFRQGSVQS